MLKVKGWKKRHLANTNSNAKVVVLGIQSRF